MSPALVSNGYRHGDPVDIIDIRPGDAAFSAENAIYDGLNPAQGAAKSFPTLLLYNTVGLQLFEDITYLDEYYLTNAEIEVLSTHAKAIAEQLPHNAQLVELGSGFVFLAPEAAGHSLSSRTGHAPVRGQIF
jgi:hypothetical protein